VNGARESGAAGAIVQEVASTFGGCTRGPFSQPTYRGYWRDPLTGVLYVDEVAPVIVDADVVLEDEGLTEQLHALRTRVLEIYDQFGSRQAEAWVVIHATRRVTG
jgi:hypothetical protein